MLVTACRQCTIFYLVFVGLMKKFFQHPILLTALGLGALMLSPYWHFFPLGWIGFGILCIPIFRHPHVIKDLIIGYIVGLLFWSSRIHSIVPAYGWEMFLKCIFLGALPWGIFMLVTSLTAYRTNSKKDSIYRITIPVSTWLVMMAAFKISAVDSFPVELMFYQPLAFMQVAAIPFGLTAFITLMMVVNIAFAVWQTSNAQYAKRIVVIGIIIGSFCGIGGLIRLSLHPIVTEGIPIAIAQTNLSINVDWRIENREVVLATYKEMAAEAALKKPKMIFFPQYSVSMLMNDKETIAFFSQIAKDTHAHVALGTFTDRLPIPNQKGKKRYNIGYVFSPTDGLVGSYRAASNLPFREIGEAFGEEYTPVMTPLGKAGIFLCYDDVVRKVSQRWNASGAEYFMVLSNPSTFASPIVHSIQLIQDQFRAIESKKTLIRASANGTSGVVDQYGRWKVRSAFNEKAILYTDVSTE